MCRPEHFGVHYAINPWMDPQNWAQRDRTLVAASRREWVGLHRALRGLGAAIDLVPAVPGLPDLVFTANAAVVLDRTALVARFRHPQRQAEEAHFDAAFRSLQARGVIDAVRHLPEGLDWKARAIASSMPRAICSGLDMGRARTPRRRALSKMSSGSKSLRSNSPIPRFYHMDTALCPLTRGEVMTCRGRSRRRAGGHSRTRGPRTSASKLRPRMRAGSLPMRFASAMTIVLSGCGRDLRPRLESRGYRVIATPLPSFLRSGGSAFCLTLRLDRRSAAMPERAAVA